MSQPLFSRSTALSWGRIPLMLIGVLFVSSGTFGPELLGAEVTLAELDNETRVHLQRVDALLASGQVVEALADLRRVMASNNSAVIEIESPHAAAGFRCYVPVQVACQMKLAAWHETAPEMLRLYRQQVDAVAQRTLDFALETHDRQRLRQVVDNYFCSRAGDDALFWLGEDAFQHGDYAAAREAWERIHPSFRWAATGTRFERYNGLPSWLLLRDIDLDEHWSQISTAVSRRAPAGRWLAYPDTDLDLNKIRARLVLASIMEGSTERATIELSILGRLAPAATGRLAGKRGNFLERLDQILAESRSWQATERQTNWTTWGGSAVRNHRVAREVDVGGSPIWQLPLPSQAWLDPSTGTARLRIGEDANRLLSFHPVVVDNLVLLGTDDASVDVQAVDLQTGQSVFGDRAEPEASVYDDRRGRSVPRFTMSASEQKQLFTVVAGEVEADQHGPLRSRLVALDLAAEGRLQFDIRLTAPAWPGSWSFEGSPVCDDAQIYVAVRHLDAVRAESHLACFDARNGELRWRQFICAAQSLSGEQGEYTNNLLTLDEGVLYYNTNCGAVAAVSAVDGAIRWLARYPRAVNDANLSMDRLAPHRFRDLTPCLVQDGLVYVAPSDCSRLFALDAATGQLVWTTPAEIGSDVMHLLGVAQGRLIASGEGLYWFDAYHGQLQAQVSGGFHPSAGHARSNPRGYGRGLLADKNVYWPTRDAIFVFEQRIIKTEPGWSPVLVREIDLTTRNATGGNLVMVGNVLLIASGDRLYAFNETGKLTHAAD